ncbi:hypothetical protein AB0O20_06415 [Streptomyces kronopolitis]|uniref:hypothetical protein n=1 Tax=Streptomyces kronopolitis TaxID=1612435 RepID=UPI00341A3CBD
MNDIASDYSWPTCVACGHELWVSENGRQACQPCEDKTAKRLAELPGLFQQLNTTASLMRGARKTGAATTGSRVPPIPPRLEVLSLVAAGGVATRLRDIEDAWRKTLGWTVAPWRGSPTEAVPEHTKFLINNLPWACDAYESIDQDIEDIRRLHTEVPAALTGERRPGRVNVGLCPTTDPETGSPCGNQLTATAASHRIRCTECGTEWADMGAWRELRLAQQAATERGAAA